MQYFKGDAKEIKVVAAGLSATEVIGLRLDAFFEGAYETVPLGEMIFDNAFAPLSNAIRRDIFARSFKQLFESFQHAGTFEAYLEVFRKIFGDDVEVEFTVPAAGKLNIVINSTNTEESTFVARQIVGNDFEYDPVITQDGQDTLVFSSIQGFTSEYELQTMLFEMVPGGIFTNITLTIGA